METNNSNCFDTDLLTGTGVDTHDQDSSACQTPVTPRSAAVNNNNNNEDGEPRHFFGKNFNAKDAMAELRGHEEDGKSLPRTPKTPCSPGAGNSLRRVLDKRRQLVTELFEEHGWYPDGNTYSRHFIKETINTLFDFVHF